MSGLLVAIALAALAGIGVCLITRSGKVGWEPVAAALLVGVAGYAFQGHPSLPGNPVSATAERKAAFDEDLVKLRQSLSDRFGPAARWQVLSDGLARQGNTEDAANILVSGLRATPRDADLWVALGNALVAHQDGILSPSAEYAFRQALAINPKGVSARYFFALALAKSGQLEPARSMWANLAADLPAQAPFKSEVERSIAIIDRMRGAGAGSDTTTP